MKIVKLNAENVKRLVAVEITPEGTLITIGGQNGAGKSSVLDSIAYALGGKALIPAEPIRKGQTDAKIEVDLGEYKVIRRFKREQVADPETGEGAMKWGPTNSTLTVQSKEGATFPSPQAMLDKLIGELTFDPLEFADSRPIDQLETLRKLTNLDTTVIDNQRKAAFDRRTALKRQHSEAQAQAKNLPTYDIKETVEISMSEVSDALLEAERKRRDADEITREVGSVEHVIHNHQTRLENLQTVLADLEARVAQQRDLITRAEAELASRHEALEDTKRLAAKHQAEVPDTAALHARIGEIEALNVKIRANQVAFKAQQAVAKLKADVEAETKKIDELDAKKQELIGAVKFPVAGLGFGADGVLLNELPFEQAATAEKIKVSVAMGLALNPTLKVLLVRDGSALDSKSLKALAEQAEAAGAQVWLERVAETKDGVTVMIEDGAVVS